jgi:hypothetical protein
MDDEDGDGSKGNLGAVSFCAGPIHAAPRATMAFSAAINSSRFQ